VTSSLKKVDATRMSLELQNTSRREAMAATAHDELCSLFDEPDRNRPPQVSVVSIGGAAWRPQA
jgi:hypothetical protein